MASRPVFMPRKTKPYVNVVSPNFVWNPGLSASQKTRNVIALHEAWHGFFPEGKVLEISSKSTEALGVQLSAFNLQKYVPELGKSVSVECVYQGSKVFFGGGPYQELYLGTSRQAKSDPRLRGSGGLKEFRFDGKVFPIKPVTAFYDWLYLNALLENPDLSEPLLRYDGFTDIEYNPDKSLACQARTAAMFVALHRAGVLEQCRDFDAFLNLLK